ncbi:MAG: hypothetical protein Kow0022_13970 [Phycisphaerales bacterium]
MPRKNTSPLRTILPLAVILAGVGIAILIAQTGHRTGPANAPSPQTPSSADQNSPETATETAQLPTPSPTQQSETPADGPAAAAQNPAAAQANQPLEPIAGLHAQPVSDPGDLGTIGSLDPASGYELEARISPLGAGIESLGLTDYFETLERTDHVMLQRTREVRIGQGVAMAVPYALTSVIVNGTRVDLTSGPNGEPVWRRRAGGRPGELESTIVDADGRGVLRIERTLSVEKNSHLLRIEQRAVNLTERPLTLVWVHTGPVSFESNTGGYGGDKRRLRFGYWLDPSSQKNDLAVLSNDFTMPMPTAIGVERLPNGLYAVPASKQIWPNAESERKNIRLVWLGMTGRYFGVSLHPLISPDAKDKTLKVARVTRIGGVDPATPLDAGKAELLNSAVLLELVESRPMVLAGKSAASFDLGAFAGPLSREVIKAEPVAVSLGLDGLVLYNFGGLCAFCTFQWLAHLLLGILHVVDRLTGDWGISIIILVVIVRTCLHPITKWSQIRLQRFSVQMQSIAPKMQKLKEKYKDDPKRLQMETTKLWKEEGINPAGMLGCLPMFLQSPVWIALYATLYFAVELRHQPAFYGVFQKIGGWPFLADLSRSDNAIPLPHTLNLGIVQINAINLLPVLLGLVFYFHQKYLTPPTTATLTPEQESQQKLMKVMMVVLFPVMMYAAPSGLSLYFITNSTLAIIENKWIRHHMNKHGLLDPDRIREQAKARRQSGFLARLQQLAAQQQEQQMASKRMMRRVKNVAPDRGDRGEPKFKKRK